MPATASPSETQTAEAPREQGLGGSITTLIWLIPLGLLGEIYRWHGRPPGGEAPLLLADPYFARLGGMLGILVPIVPSLLLLVGALVAQVSRREPWKMPSGRTLAMVGAWGLTWAVARLALGLAAHALAGDAFARPSHGPTLLHAGLALCGALQEELIFRGAVAGGLFLLGRALAWPRWAAATLAVGASAVLFALAHTSVLNHFPGAEPFAWPAFTERAVAGLLYGYVFLRQGLAVCVLAHAGYNLALLALAGTAL